MTEPSAPSLPLPPPSPSDVPLAAAPPPAPARAPGTRRRAISILVAVAAAILGLGYYLSDVLNPLLIALLIAYALNPVVEALERRRIGRRFAVAVLFAVVLFGVVGLVTYAAFEAAHHFEALRGELSGEPILDPRNPRDRARIEAVAHVDSRSDGGFHVIARTPAGELYVDENGDGKRKVGILERVSAALSPRLQKISRQEIEDFLRAIESQAGQALSIGAEASRGLGNFLKSLGNLVGYVLLVPIYTFFLLSSLTDIRTQLRDHLPGRSRARVIDLATKIDRAVGAFFRGRLLLALAKTLLIWLGLAILGVRFAFLIALISGVLSIFPFVGPVIGAGLAFAVAYDSSSSATTLLVALVVLFSVAEVVENGLFPIVIGRETGLHPLALIVSLFAFGKLFGLFGVLLAVPIACIIKICFVELVLPELRALAREEPAP